MHELSIPGVVVGMKAESDVDPEGLSASDDAESGVGMIALWASTAHVVPVCVVGMSDDSELLFVGCVMPSCLFLVSSGDLSLSWLCRGFVDE